MSHTETYSPFWAYPRLFDDSESEDEEDDPMIGLRIGHTGIILVVEKELLRKNSAYWEAVLEVAPDFSVRDPYYVTEGASVVQLVLDVLSGLPPKDPSRSWLSHWQTLSQAMELSIKWQLPSVRFSLFMRLISALGSLHVSDGASSSPPDMTVFLVEAVHQGLSAMSMVKTVLEMRSKIKGEPCSLKPLSLDDGNVKQLGASGCSSLATWMIELSGLLRIGPGPGPGDDPKAPSPTASSKQSTISSSSKVPSASSTLATSTPGSKLNPRTKS